MRRNESGRSMMEMLGVLSVIGLLSAGGLAGVNRLFAQQRVNKAVEQIGVMSAKLSQIGAQSGSYDGLTISSALKFGAVPSSAIDSPEDGTLINPFGGDIEIEPANLVPANGDRQAYTITYDGVPEDACMALSTYKWASKGSASLIGVGAGPSDMYKATVKNKLKQDCAGEAALTHVIGCSGGEELDLPIDPVSAINACNCTEGSCFLVWMYF